MKNTTYIRFSGRLRKNLEFEPTRGWETERIARKPLESKEEDSHYRVNLLNGDDKIILTVIPEVSFITSCERSGNQPPPATVIAYLPLHPEARSIRFKHKDFTIYERAIANKPPSVEIAEVDINDETVFLSWKSEANSDLPLTFNVVYIVNKLRTFTLGRDLRKQSGKFSIDHLPGGASVRVTVLATDGLRSDFAISKAFKVKERPKEALIIQPPPDGVFPSGTHVSFCGRGHDVAGASLPEKNLIWKLDDEIIAEGTCMGTIENPKIGDHTLSIEVVENKKVVAREKRSFRVNKLNARQERYFKILESLDN